MSDIEDAVAEAARIAKSVPEELRTAAFEKAFDAILGGGGQQSATRGKSRRSTKRKGGVSATKSSSKKRTATKKKGGKASLEELIDDGYFKQPRTLKDIVDHLKHAKARTFKQSDLSGPLGRLTSSGSLKREQNEDGKYAYEVEK